MSVVEVGDGDTVDVGEGRGVLLPVGRGGLDDTPPPIPEPRPTDAPEQVLPEPTPAPAPEWGETIQAIICSYPWDCGTAIRVFSCESKLQPDTISYNESSYGVTQIWKGHAWRFPGFWEQWMIPEVNIGWAYELWSEQGWGPWRESQGCWWR